MKKLHKLSVATAILLSGSVLPMKTASAADAKGIFFVPSYFVPMTPCRVLDTRGGVAGIADPFDTPDEKGNEQRDFFIWGGDIEEQGGNPDACTVLVPNTAVAVHINLTAVSPTGTGFLRAWARGGEEAKATLMAWDRLSISNATAISFNNDDNADLTIKIFHPAGSGATLNLVGDVVGYYLPMETPTAEVATVLAEPSLATISGAPQRK